MCFFGGSAACARRVWKVAAHLPYPARFAVAERGTTEKFTWAKTVLIARFKRLKKTAKQFGAAF
ncbi:MAG: hypothetical protein DBX55_10320 [Verrucomicrobia bacterium]|nr:MAG: hypothetical protein DBX55_10320 [Verrucomicrobiota bacterium]